MSATATIDRKNATPRQLAAHKQTSVPTVLTWYRKGIIPATVAEGKVFRFDLDAVDAALEARAKSKKEASPAGAAQ